MARHYQWKYLKDEEGRPISNAGLNLYLTGTEIEANLYSIPISGNILNQSTWVTDETGFFDFYIGNELETTGYTAEQYFDLVWTSETRTGIIDKIQIFPFIFTVDETNNDSDKNKVLNNQLAYKFEYHIDHDYSTQPHGIKPVDTDDPYDSTYDKVVTNELMNKIDNLLDTLLTCGGDAITISTSGTLVDTILLDTFTSSGDGYYTDLEYSINRNRMYPILQFYEYYGIGASGSNQIIYPRAIENIDLDTIRVWTASNDWLMATVIASGK